MFQRLITFGVREFFGGARRGQPIVTAFGAALSIWGLFRRYGGREKLIYSRALKDGETVTVAMLRPGGPRRRRRTARGQRVSET